MYFSGVKIDFLNKTIPGGGQKITRGAKILRNLAPLAKILCTRLFPERQIINNSRGPRPGLREGSLKITARLVEKLGRSDKNPVAPPHGQSIADTQDNFRSRISLWAKENGRRPF